MRESPIPRLVFAGVVAGLLVAVVPALDAYAHVTVSSPDATPGGFGKVVFRVPNESDSATTTAITVTLPSDTPFPFVSVGAIPGWTATTTSAELPRACRGRGLHGRGGRLDRDLNRRRRWAPARAVRRVPALGRAVPRRRRPVRVHRHPDLLRR